ncbi:MAG: hypothetical protein KVP17_004956 [Porospora cf. gigantea B]|uniref:uncharacterized protein n=1 Tax=Porospora cf. gigantea B TaxID=2853592 RepID=UPI003571F9FB|nr:MAG: hypothetical protein KVP17_004956 [Porospora cf. gigantea B]
MAYDFSLSDWRRVVSNANASGVPRIVELPFGRSLTFLTGPPRSGKSAWLATFMAHTTAPLINGGSGMEVVYWQMGPTAPKELGRTTVVRSLREAEQALTGQAKYLVVDDASALPPADLGLFVELVRTTLTRQSVLVAFSQRHENLRSRPFSWTADLGKDHTWQFSIAIPEADSPAAAAFFSLFDWAPNSLRVNLVRLYGGPADAKATWSICARSENCSLRSSFAIVDGPKAEPRAVDY